MCAREHTTALAADLDNDRRRRPVGQDDGFPDAAASRNYRDECAAFRGAENDRVPLRPDHTRGGVELLGLEQPVPVGRGQVGAEGQPITVGGFEVAGDAVAVAPERQCGTALQ